MPATEAELHLDGNAVAGWLTEIFIGDITTAEVTCVNCGRSGAVGSLTAYGLEMGVILRCPGCDHSVLRATRGHERAWVDLRGTITLRLGPASA